MCIVCFLFANFEWAYDSTRRAFALLAYLARHSLRAPFRLRSLARASVWTSDAPEAQFARSDSPVSVVNRTELHNRPARRHTT